MTRRPQLLRQQQLFQAISEYLENAGLIQKRTSAFKDPAVYKLELAVRSLNLQRQP